MSKDPRLCSTPRCMHKMPKGKKYGPNWVCGTCSKRRWRKEHPMEASYQTLKYNSTRRKVYFDLTFEEFKEVCYKYDYMAGKGRTRLSYTVDRKIEGKKPGYTKDNIQCLPKGVNSQKEMARRQKKILIYDWQTGTATVI